MAAPVPVPIDQRFAQLIQQFGLTKNSFAISLGKTASVVQHLIDGRNKPGYDLLCKVFEIYPNVSRDWLLLGRGPMLVGGEPTPKAVATPAKATPEPLLEPIDLSDVEARVPRRPSPGVAGTRLQPAEIAATLALASAAAQPAHATASELAEASEAPEMRVAPGPLPAPEMPVEPARAPAAAAPAPSAPIADIPAASPGPSMAGPATAPAPTVAAPVAATAAGLSPETYITAALHAQHLQHQLALAEMRNQHLLEQQQMLREMLAMARQSMV